MIPIIKAYAERYLSPLGIKEHQLPGLPEEKPPLAMWSTVREWHNMTDATAKEIVQKARETIMTTNSENPRENICYLTSSHKTGKEIEYGLKNQGISCETIFSEEDGEERRRLKRSFWSESPEIKGCTIHSFKGWQAKHIVIINEENEIREYGKDPNSEALLYVAMTRIQDLAEHTPASIKVINTIPKFADFKEIFEA